MGNFVTELKTVKVRNDHICCCYEIFMDSGFSKLDVDEKYHKAIDKMKSQKGLIKKGEECFFWSGRFDGEMFSSYADKDLYNLVAEMEWFDY